MRAHALCIQKHNAAHGGLCRSFPEFLIGMVAWRMHEAKLFAGSGWFVFACLAVAVTIWLGAPDALIVAEFVILLLSAPNVALLEWRPFVFLGEISYSLYMTHLLTGYVTSSLLWRSGFGNWAVYAMVGPVVSVAFATMTYWAVEVPARATLRAWMGGNGGRGIDLSRTVPPLIASGGETTAIAQDTRGPRSRRYR